MGEKLIRCQHHLTEGQVEALEVICSDTGVKRAVLIRHAIDAYLQARSKRKGAKNGR